MENRTESNKEMTAQESLTLISETLNNSRKDITRRSAKYWIHWGILLTVFSLVIYALCKATGSEAWNYLWFAMPAIGFPMERLLRGKEDAERVQNDVSRIVGGIWGTFGIFAGVLSALTILYSEFSSNTIKAIGSMMALIPEITLLFGLAECISGVAVKNWIIKIAGAVTALGGLALYYITGANEEQLLIFTFAGLVLIATGLIVKRQYK